MAPDRERRWVWVFSLLVMVATTIPYLVGFISQGDQWRFTGFVFGVEDGNSYIAKMLNGARGAWLFRTPYTAQPQRGVLAFFPYLLLGKLAGPQGSHPQLVALFHLFRFLAGVMAIHATYDFLTRFLQTVTWRRWALGIAVLGGGLGWVLALLGRSTWLGSLPLEFYSPESFGFLALYGLPHLALARALLLWGLAAFLANTSSSEPPGPGGWTTQRVLRWWIMVGEGAEQRRMVLVGVLWSLLGLAQPLTVVIAWGVLGATLGFLGLMRWIEARRGEVASCGTWWALLRRGFWVVVLSSPLVIYTALAFSRDPFLRAWTAQNLIISPHPLHYLLAYGLLLPFAALGARHLVRREPWRGWLPVVWILLLPALAYAPYNLQRRLPEGVWVALVVLAAAFFEMGVLSQPVRRRLAAGVVTLSLPSTAILLLGGLVAASRPAQPLFRPADEVAVMQVLAKDAPPGSVTLAAFETGNVLPAWAPVRVVIGHGPESVSLAELKPRVAAFYDSATSDHERRALLDEFGVRYVFWGPAERALGDWDPAVADDLQLLTSQGGYQVYQLP